jgi:hypothetical protein
LQLKWPQTCLLQIYVIADDKLKALIGAGSCVVVCSGNNDSVPLCPSEITVARGKHKRRLKKASAKHGYVLSFLALPAGIVAANQPLGS